MSFVTISFLLISIYWMLKIARSVSWLEQVDLSKLSGTEIRNHYRLFVIIPVLNEARILEETVDYFVDLLTGIDNATLVIVTTEKEFTIEERFGDTIAVAARLKQRNPTMQVMHYPEKNGKMAHQLNFSIKTLDDTKQIKDDDLIAIYNADSRPDRNTFRWVVSRYKPGEREVFQQFGDYTGNLSEVRCDSNFFRRSVILSAIAWQTRWSLGFELPHSLDQFGFLSRLGLTLGPLNYCIGHGLFLSYVVYKKVDGFNEKMHNEDAILGLQLSIRGITIEPIPFLDKVRVPDSIKALFLQQASWFFGPLQSFEYFRILSRSGRRVVGVKDFVLSSKLFSHAVYWIVGPGLFLAMMGYFIIFPSVTSFFQVVAVWVFFLVLPSNYALVEMMRLNASDFHKNIDDSWPLVVGMPVFYLLHGIAGIRSTFKYVIRYVTGREISKEKTVMFSQK